MITCTSFVRIGCIALAICRQLAYGVALFWGKYHPVLWLLPTLLICTLGIHLVYFRYGYDRMWGGRRGVNFTPRASVVCGVLFITVGVGVFGSITLLKLLGVLEPPY